MSKHTPGPWKFVDEPDDSLIAVVRPWGNGVTPGNEPTFGSGLGAHIAQLEYTQTGVPTRERAIANARLIAAAPGLLIALRDLCDDWPGPSTEALRAAHVALRAAELEEAL